MTGSGKKLMLVSTLLGALGTTSAFQGPFLPGKAAAIRLNLATGQASSTSAWTSPSRGRKATGGAAMALGELFEDGLVSRIFGGFGGDETTLPQDPDADTDGRKEELEKQRELYEWRLEGTPIDLPYLEGFPPTEQLPTAAWISKIVTVVVRTLLGAVRGTIGVGEVVEALSDPEKAKNFATRISELIGGDETNERPVDIDDYNDLHAFPIKTPESLYDYDEDDAFARQRLQGANCIVIEKCRKVTRNKLKILDEDSDYADLKVKVDSLLQDGKLFVIDHKILKDMEASPLNEHTPRYLAKGIALFEATDDELLPLKPIGIQLTQGETATPIFTPTDGYNWKIAKACFEGADFIIHEVVSHLSFTHVVLEAPMVSMNRQLAKAHPLNALLAPHFEGTALINWGAQEILMTAGGAVDQLTANTIEDSWDMVKEQTLKRISKDFSPEADFEARGMTKDDFPGRHMYRDQGLKYWDATHTWVKEYLDLYYASKGDLEDDSELQYVASLIYSASALHAAVNMPQQSITSYVPNSPGSVYTPIPTDKAARGFDEYLAYLPHMELATTQVVLGNVLGSVLYTKLGDYEADQFSDEKVREPLQKFQQAIEDIETDLVDENALLTQAWKARGKDKKDAANFGYSTLLPDRVPQSINI